MILKIRSLFINPKILASTLIGFIFINLLGLFITFFFYNIFSKSFFNLGSTSNLITFSLYITIIYPLVIILSLFIVERYLKNNNPYLFSVMAGGLATLILGIMGFYVNSKNIEGELFRNLISICGLITIWTILFQSKQKIEKILSTGYFVFICLNMFIFQLQKSITGDKTDWLRIILEIIGGFIGCVIISRFFETIIKINFKLFRIQN